MLYLEVEKEWAFAIRLKVNIGDVGRVLREWIGQVALFDLVEHQVLLHVLCVEALLANRESFLCAIQWTDRDRNVEGLATRSLVSVATSDLPRQQPDDVRAGAQELSNLYDSSVAEATILSQEGLVILV